MESKASLVKMIFLMALFVIAGIPFVAYLWETLNELLALEADPVRLLIAIPVLLILLGLLTLLARSIRRWTDETDATS